MAASTSPPPDPAPRGSGGGPTPAGPPTSGDAPTAGDVAAAFCRTLVDEWCRLGLTDVVVSPGSRSTPFTVAAALAQGVRVHVALDERTAGFMALGLALGTGRPAAVACTSGTAATHFLAPVVEADLAAVPLLVVTADRPPELRGVLAPQTIDQRELYGRAVRWYCEPGPPEPGGAPWWRDLAADAWSRATGVLPGPVHLDLAFREPLLGSADAGPGSAPRPAPLPRPRASWGIPDEDAARLCGAVAGRRGVIVAGARTAADDAEADAVHALAEHLDWPVLADGPSGVRRARPGTVTTFDALLRHAPFAEAHRPEVVLRMGGLLASKVANRWLAGSGATQIALDRHGRCPDPDHVVARSFPVPPAVVASAVMAGTPKGRDGGRSSWVGAERLARRALSHALDVGDATEPAVAVDVMSAVPAGGALVVSSSMPVRDLEWFAPARDDVTVLANRGANGIDGVTATAVGVALGRGGPTVLLTGDLAFLHDSSTLVGLARRPADLVVVVVDNDGGGIFEFLPQAGALGRDDFERLFATPHGSDVAALAAAHGLSVEAVSSRVGLQAALAGALARGGPRVVVVRTDRRANVAVHDRLNAAVAAALARAAGRR